MPEEVAHREQRSPGSEIRPLAGKLRAVVGLDPDAPAIEYQGRSLPWSFIAGAIEDIEALLASEASGDVQSVGIVLRNRPEHFAMVIAAVATGRTLVTLSPFHGDQGLSEDVVALRPSVVVAGPEDWSRPGVTEAAEEMDACRVVLGADRAVAEVHTPVSPGWGARVSTDLAVLMLTSGTTGRPKRVPLTYDQLSAAFDSAGTGAALDRPPQLKADTAILSTPLVHIGGLYFAISNVLEGRRTALLERFEVNGWADAVRRFRPRVVSLQPTAMRMVMASDISKDVFEGTIGVLSGTAPLKPEEADRFEERFGVPVLTNYGATEFAGAVAGWNLKDHKRWGSSKRGSVGRPHPGIELRVVEQDSGEELAVGQVGLLHVRGHQLPDSEVDGWTRTTDLASIDADGFLYIHGRADDAINRGGFKIVPGVVVDVLRAHPAVEDAAVTAMPHARLGQVPVAAVTLSEGLPRPTEEELKAWVAGRLAKYFVPVAVAVVPELPRTPSLKVSQPGVRALFSESELGD